MPGTAISNVDPGMLVAAAGALIAEDPTVGLAPGPVPGEDRSTREIIALNLGLVPDPGNNVPGPDLYPDLGIVLPDDLGPQRGDTTAGPDPKLALLTDMIMDTDHNHMAQLKFNIINLCQ